ncbi:MAG: DegT/DnrJ/EryC1/StrS family aminotransferase [Deltaproteobacteria bacterium]|nr:DegT/DnrJ/EryC1/StrS family aminotransferase [Deltaproteobacteria bacterium]
MSIRVWSYLEEYHAEKAEIHEAIDAVLESGSLILADQVAAFEEEFARYCGAGYGVGVANGTDAIFLALLSLGIGEGDEVITVSNTAVPTVSAIVSTGATPRFVDIDPDTYLMDCSKVEDAVGEKTRCILPVHLYGQCVDMNALRDIANRHGLKLVEDCAQSHGASFAGATAGSMSDAAAFSFYPTKLLGGYGDGGMVLTSDEATDAKLRRLRFYGMDGRYYAKEHGYNSRLDELHAAILRKKLAHLDEYIAKRREIAGRYDRLLADTALVLPKIAPGNEHAYYLYVVRHEQRDRIVTELASREIFVNVSYPWPIHTMTAYESFGDGAGSLPVCEAVADQIFSLPMYPALTEAQQRVVVDALRELAPAD